MSLLKKFDEYFERICPEDKIAVLHDTDPDGLCSAVIIAKFIERLKGRKIDFLFFLEEKKIDSVLEKKLKKKKINKLIVLDVSLDQDYVFLNNFGKELDILILDHHKIYLEKKLKNVLLIKPQLISEIPPYKYCAAKLVYDLCSRMLNLEDLDWLAASASIADIAHDPWKDWLLSVFKKYDIGIEKNLFDTCLGKIASMISSAEVSDKKNIAKCFNILYSAKKPKDVFVSFLIDIKKKVDSELDVLLKGFKNSEKHSSLHIYEINSSVKNIKSPLSTILGLKFPKKTIMIVDFQGQKVSVSARRGDKRVAVNDLLETAVRGLPDSNAGGHIPSAGASLRKKDYCLFKKKLIEEHSKFKL
jgi:oligoribonuclease NrnB/cAMP/cGMP phosphodiesterase (DHH superfamily)